MLAIRREAVLLVGVLAVAACSKSDTGPNVTNNTNACASSTPVSLAVGQVVVASAGATGCTIAGGSAHQEYVLVPFYGTTTNTATTQLTVSGSGLDQLSTTPVANVMPLTNMLPDTTLAAGGAPLVADHNFDVRLRHLERQALPRLFTAARQVRAAATPSFSTVPGTVKLGDTVSLNTNAEKACDTGSAIVHKAVVTAITSKAIVVADVNNPPGGFTPAEYQSVATTFDTLVDPVDEQNFGAPTDIDNNGHIVLFFTETVNQLTPPNSKSYVGGFFFARDLFPTTATASLPACPPSNYAEMFYLMVPDPTGVINGNRFDTTMVFRNTVATTGHEYQHLINAARRLYVNNASDFEEVWLNEGLSHMAEALLFYRESGLAPREDIDSIKIRSSQKILDALNEYQGNNFGRYHEFVTEVGKFGPYSENDSLATRGATWMMLRYLTDQKNSNDAAIFTQLVNSTTTGLSNLQKVYGSNVMDQVRDFATTVYTDDLPGVAAEWQEPSWNIRSMMHVYFHAYPLQMQALAPSAPVTLSMVAGGSEYVQFATAAGRNATLQFAASGGQAPPTGMQFSLVRIQ